VAATLWWTYFDAAAEIDLRVLTLSGGSPAVARAIFAAGHMLPAFALLIAASGVGLLLRDDPTRIGYELACTGVGIYLAGTRGYMYARGRWRRVIRTAAIAGTFALGALHSLLSPQAFLWLLAAWAAGNALLTTFTGKPLEVLQAAESQSRTIDRPADT